jgi:hypothetical protein
VRGFDTFTAGLAVVFLICRPDSYEDMIQFLARAARGHKKVAEGYINLPPAVNDDERV